MRKIKLIGSFILLTTLAVAQQDPLFTQYMNNPVSINPAYAGSRGSLNLISLLRQQWVGLDGAPRTTTFSMNTPIPLMNFGLGINFINDKIGPINQNSIFIDYSYTIKLNKKNKLAMGLKGGFNSLNKDFSKSLPTTASDPLIDYSNVQDFFLPNFGLGFYLYGERYYAGLSIPKLFVNSLDKNNKSLLYNGEERHFFFMGGAVFDINQYWRFKPSATLRMVNGSPISFELTPYFLLYDKLWLGAMYRVGDAVGALVQYQISPKFRIGYAYDMTNSRLRYGSSGSHEILISYDFDQRNKKILSPRYF